MSEYPLLCLGNPLLEGQFGPIVIFTDIQANGDKALLDKYELKTNDAILAEEKHLYLYDDLTTKYHPKYLAGGAAQNSARGAQYALPPKSVVYIGCIGKDAYGEQVNNACVKEGVLTKYRIDEDQLTGRCGVIITGLDRSMVTDLGAANHYKLEHLKSPEIWSYVENARIFYVGGFHLTVCVPAILALGEHAAETNKVFSINLSAPFIPQFFKDQLDSVLPYCDYLIGNESEAISYAESHNLDVNLPAPAIVTTTNSPTQSKDIAAIAKAIAILPKKNPSRPRTVVITQGTEPTIVVVGSAEPVVTSHPVRPVDSKDIVDTNGAGDAFAGGFLAALVQGKDLNAAVDMGHWLASLGIKELGPAYPAEKKLYSESA